MQNDPETNGWPPALSPTITSVLIWTTIAFALIAIAFWWLARLRRPTDDRYDSNGLLANLEELRSRGEISESEYRTIQTARDKRRRPTDPDRPAASPDRRVQAGSTDGDVPPPATPK